MEGASLRVLGIRGLDPTKPHDDELMPEIAALLADAGLRARDVTDIGVSAGPGGYTAVRLAVTTAKLIAEATGARVVPVPSALVAAWGAAPKVDARGVDRFAVAISSKGVSTHLTSFEVVGEGARALDTGVIVEASGLEMGLAKHGARVLVGDRFLPSGIAERAAVLGVVLLAPEFNPVMCLRASMGLEAVEPLELLPMYAREPEAVTKWRELGKAKAKSEERKADMGKD
jgi:tRNA A37 threonylcarbamoyladenosine modification protein TsaB